MKIAFISAMARHPWGGSEELWAGAAKHLAADGHRVAVNVPGWPQRHAKVAALMAAGLSVHERTRQSANPWGARLRRLLGLQNREAGPPGFSRWLGDFRPDLVCVSNGNYKDGLPWLRHLSACGIPFVSVVQANAEFLWPSDAERAVLAPVYEAARAVYCVSEANLRLLEKQLAVRLPRAQVVRNPYQIGRESPPPPWPDPVEPLRLACVARLDPDAKGQDLIFEVLNRPEWRGRAVEVSLFGTGEAREGLQRLAEVLALKGKIHFCGHVDDITQVWERHHALILPSRYEGLPLALVEALLCGRPAIVTDVAGNPEIISDGETGFIAAAPNASRLADAMERAWNARDALKTMGIAARQHILKLVPPDPCRDFADALLRAAGKTDS